MPDPANAAMTPQAARVDPEVGAEVQERRRQARGLLLIALAVIALSILRTGIHQVFPPHWWHLW